MRKILGPIGLIIISLIVIYYIRESGFDVVVAIGILAIIGAIAITIKITTARSKKNQEN